MPRGAALLVLIAMLAAGCAGGEVKVQVQGDKQRADFMSAASAICAQRRDRLAHLPRGSTRARFLRRIDRAAAVQASALVQLEALFPPRAQQEEFGRLLTASHSVLAATKDYRRALERRNELAATRAAGRAEAAARQADRAAHLIGLESCRETD
jgi:hypothetical protein